MKQIEVFLGDLPGELWRDVVGYEGLYEASNLGRVKSLPKQRGRCYQTNSKKH